MTRLPRAAADHELALIDRWIGMGFSSRTIDLYLRNLRRVRTWCEQRGLSIENMPAHAVLEYADGVPRTRSSRCALRSSLKRYWEAIGRQDAPHNAVRVPSLPRVLKTRALDEDIASALERAAVARRDERGLAVLLGLYLGLRRAEIAALRWSDFDARLEWLTIVGKFDITATLPVHPVLRAALLSAPRDTVWVFPGRFGAHVTPTTVWTWVRGVAKQAELDPVNTHSLRHTCLTTANDATRDLRAVQVFARHAQPETTARYTRVRARRLLDVMNSLDYRMEGTA